MRTRGKRVTAEAVVPRQVLIDVMRVEPESLASHWASPRSALLLRRQQQRRALAQRHHGHVHRHGPDVANVAESSAGILFSELTPSVTLHLAEIPR